MATFTVLQDPSVASSPVEKKIAFLESKNLTKEEVELAFTRMSEGPAATNAVNSGSVARPVLAQRQQSPYSLNHGYGPYQTGPWGPPPPTY